MIPIEHFQKLRAMYLSAPINQKLYPETEIEIGEGFAEISLPLNPDFHHALHALHGSVYFKMLDDAAFFAVQSLVESHFILTSSFQINILKPIRTGKIIAKGNVKFESKSLFFGESGLFDESGREIAFGTGTFVKSEVILGEKIGYRME